MYSAEARSLRRCRGTTVSGANCRAWAAWGSQDQLCVNHSGRHHRGPISKAPRAMTRFWPSCRCSAYSWPHRPGGGLCRWPEGHCGIVR